MECSKVYELLNLYVYEIASSEEVKLLQEHLLSCYRCGEIYKALKKESELIREAIKNLQVSFDSRALQAVLAYIPEPLVAGTKFYLVAKFNSYHRWSLEKEVITIGRASDCKIILEDKKVSRYHARIELTPERKYKIIDLDSTNGVLVNGIRVSEAVLNPGDIIRIGRYELEFVAEQIPAKEKASITQPHLIRQRWKKFSPQPAKASNKKLLTWGLVGLAASILIIFIIVLSNQAKQERKKTRDDLLPALSESYKHKQEERRREQEAKRKQAEEERLRREAAARAEEEKRLAEERKQSEEEQLRQEELARLLQEEEQKRQREREADLKRQQEEARQKEDIQKRLIQEQKKVAQTKSVYEEHIKNYRFSKAVSLCEDLLNSIQNETLKNKVSIWLDEAKRQQQVFNKLLKRLVSEQSKFNLGTFSIFVEKADEEGIEGPPEGNPQSRYFKRWIDLKPDLIFAHFDLSSLSGEDLFNLAIFCYNRNLILEADRCLILYYRANPEKKDVIDKLIATKKNIEIPKGGFEIYQGRWVSAEEKTYLEKGYIKHEGKWLTYDEYMAATGHIKYEGRWVTKEEHERLLAARKRLDALKKQLAPKGVIDEPGADKEQLPWEKARKKITDHYEIITNLSEEALNDIACVMETLYYNFMKVFRIKKEPSKKLIVKVFKNRQEYNAAGGRGEGLYSARGVLMTFYHPNKRFSTTRILLHEGTHQFIHMYCNYKFPPIWCNEGLAVYYEAQKFEGKELTWGLIPRDRLQTIKQMIKNGTARSFKDHLNISQAQHGAAAYAQSWSMIYFLIHGKNYRYAPKLQKYFEEIAEKGDLSQSDPQGHLKLFENIFMVPFDDLDKEWREYIMNLPEPEKTNE